MTFHRFGYLASFRSRGFDFTSTSIPPLLTALWQSLAENDTRNALTESRRLLRDPSTENRELLAALFAASAEAELRAGNPIEALNLARRSLLIYPDQWMAHGICINAFEAEQDSQQAYAFVSSIEWEDGTAGWDEPPTSTELHILIAALAWRVQEWDDVARHVALAYPDGIDSMPDPLKSDWFRLAFYRDNPLDAAYAARSILSNCSIDELDELLNTMVQNGWTSEALPLYRTAFTMHPESELLRRRLVGLCIREGSVDEARDLASSGALNIAV